MTPHPPLRSYGRIKARTLKPSQARALATLAARAALPEGPLAVETVFAGAQSCVLEIGFGAGEHLLAQAAANPTGGFIGVEPFLNGVASCLRDLEAAGLENVRIHQGDARDVLARSPDGAFSCIYVLFPDPWPKARHWKRRLLQSETVAEIARVLRPGGELRFATDWADYGAWTLQRVLAEPRLSWLAESAADWREPWPGHAPTRYQRKQLGDCAPLWLRARRI